MLIFYCYPINIFVLCISVRDIFWQYNEIYLNLTYMQFGFVGATALWVIRSLGTSHKVWLNWGLNLAIDLFVRFLLSNPLHQTFLEIVKCLNQVFKSWTITTRSNRLKGKCFFSSDFLRNRKRISNFIIDVSRQYGS